MVFNRCHTAQFVVWDVFWCLGNFVLEKTVTLWLETKCVMEVKYPTNIREEELKLHVAKDYFGRYDTAKIIGNIDFCVAVPDDGASLFDLDCLLWAEAKAGTSHNVLHSFVQLILTIGKARTFEKFLPPQFLGAFDCARFAFIPYHAIRDVFYQNDFNWNVTASDHNSKEFKQLFGLVEKTLNENLFEYNYFTDDKALRAFIKENLIVGTGTTKKRKVNKNNFTFVYRRWCDEVKDSIAVDWERVKKSGFLDADFFLADLLSKDNATLADKLHVLLRDNRYILDRHFGDDGLFVSKEAQFKDEMRKHTAFWNKYDRPPKREYWDYIVDRRDLLVPQDVRERKGSYFTPQTWAELSKQYLAAEFGEDWQDEYYVWDCCAGTGNLLVGLTNPRNIWASTLDKADVDAMHELVRNGLNLLDHHIFQFDFLNDDFSKLPKELLDIINDREKSRRLIVYINPPYAEASNARQRTGTGENRAMLAKETAMYAKYVDRIKTAARELFAQFFIRVHHEIRGSKLAEFSTLKILQASNFSDFRNVFRADLRRMFIVPAATFDNVKGKFPIGFMVWDLDGTDKFTETVTDMYNADGSFFGQKKLVSYDNDRLVIEWLRQFYDKQSEPIAYLRMLGTDMQNNNGVFITSKLSDNDVKKSLFTIITRNNVVPMVTYCIIRHVIEETWYNDRDQFCYPSDEWMTDREFQLDCLVYGLFDNSNRVSSEHGTNHWIPFYEDEVGIKNGFDSHFMQDFIRDFTKGKMGVKPQSNGNNIEIDFGGVTVQSKGFEPVAMSDEATQVMTSGKRIWAYYAEKIAVLGGNHNASLYDIKEYFKGRDEKGRMNSKSEDERFNELMDDLRVSMQSLCKAIVPKIYSYGFLK